MLGSFWNKRLFGLGFILSALYYREQAWGRGFDGLYGQDPYAYLDYAQQLIRLFTTGVPLGGWYYPLGAPALYALGVVVDGVNGALWIAALCGAGACVACAGIAYRLTGMWQAGLATGLICLACPQLTQSSIVIMSDVPALCFAAGCVYAAIRYRDSERTEWLTLSGVLLSVALMCRWQYALSVIPIAIWVFPKRGVTVKLIRTVLIAGGVAGCVYLPQALMTIRDGERYRTSQITWNIENIGRNQFTTADGVIQYTLPNFAYYTLPLSSPYYLSPLLIPFALIGIGWLWRRDRRTAVGWIVWGVSHYLFLSGLPVQNIRYALSVFLPVAILVGIGVGVSLGYAQQRSPANSRASTFR